MIDRAGELFLHHFFLLTDWSEEQMPAEELLAFYRKRGTHEGHLGEFMNALKVALSCTSRPKKAYGGKKVKNHGPSRSREEEFFCNEATLLLNVWAYNLANQVRHLVERALPQDRGPSATLNPGGWSLTRVQQCVLRVVARFLMHSRRVVAVIGEASAMLWNSLAPLIARFPRIEMPKRFNVNQAPDGYRWRSLSRHHERGTPQVPHVHQAIRALVGCPDFYTDLAQARIEAPAMESDARVHAFGQPTLVDIFHRMERDDFQQEYELSFNDVPLPEILVLNKG
jgi:hypothetical protein